MTSTGATTINLSEQIKNLRKEAETAKKAFNYELAFMLIDQADSLERQELKAVSK